MSPKPPTEQDWQDLTSQKTITTARKKAEERYARLTSDDLTYLRNRAQNDLFFLSNSVLGYSRLSPNLHGSLCSWLQRTRNEQYRMVLLPRSHFKTTIATIADSIHRVLESGPDIRLLLAHESHEGSTRFLYEITSHFCNNPRFMGLFPELVPSPRIQRMNKFELELPRSGHWAEPTFDTIGVGGRSQGRHYNIIKLDDLFGDKARDSKAERETTIQWFDNIQAFLVRLTQDKIDLIGTRWSLDDVYNHAMKIYADKMIRYIRRIKERNAEGELVPIFPEEFNDDALAILKKNPKVWAAQYVNDPREGSAEFQPEWKRYYYWAGVNKSKVSFFAGKSETPTSYTVKDLDITILIDPAVSGKPGIVVTGTDDKLRVFVLEAIKEPMGPTQFVNLLFRLVMKWWPRIVAIEEVVFSAVYKPWIESEMRVRNVRFNIIPVKPKRLRNVDDHSKPGRVRGLANYFSSGQILFNEGQHDLIEEYDNFGATDDYHLLDALAYGPEVWRHGLQAKQYDNYRKMEEEVLSQRDIATGY